MGLVVGGFYFSTQRNREYVLTKEDSKWKIYGWIDKEVDQKEQEQEE